jgi:hypothetical protein
MPTSPEVRERLSHIKTLIAHNRKAQAKELLLVLLKDDPTNARAWYMSSFVFDDLDLQIAAVQKTLEYKPDSMRAEERLKHLQAQRQIDSVDLVLSTAPSRFASQIRPPVPAGDIQTAMVSRFPNAPILVCVGIGFSVILTTLMALGIDQLAALVTR